VEKYEKPQSIQSATQLRLQMNTYRTKAKQPTALPKENVQRNYGRNSMPEHRLTFNSTEYE
jgi:hypothetical protein